MKSEKDLIPLKDSPCAVITPDEKFVFNGDGHDESEQVGSDAWNILEHLPSTFSNSITLSFLCVSKFLKVPKNKISIRYVAELLVKGTLEIIDSTADRTIPLSHKEEKLYHDNKFEELIAPPGFTFMGVATGWHSAGTTLIRNVKEDKTYLFGIDEEMYFGVELPSNVHNIREAYKLLTPKEALCKKGVIRQGEWFAVPVQQKDLPKVTECIGFIDGNDDSAFALSVDHEDSSKHWVSSLGKEGRVDKSGQVFCNGFRMTHSNNEHVEIGTLTSSRWYTFYKNTAVRSVSQQGVD